ncbi:hypothetical protein [Dolichospermum circinale]|uniref:hypothetical protein n=1 Tax=Dolichospermum circinale TaxID=109265 RepID=UPI00232F9236|nr:hypothetical protein [Dolichospermum circinale]MDB9448568.1 hypothetical protein [Dolichospermum circinale CS-547]
MVKRRARLEDNDPLSSTDRVLAGFEQMSKSASQQSNQSTSQEADVLAGQEEITKHELGIAPDLVSSESETTSQQSDKLTIQQVDNLTSQQPIAEKLVATDITINEKTTSQQVDKLTIQQDNNITSQQPTMEQSAQVTINEKITSQQSDKSTSQIVDNIEKPKLRQSTFQISETVLLQLEQMHLTLQLELGKAIAPYKEVIVEEALVRLLEQFVDDRPGLIEVLVSKRKSRDKS